MQGRRVKRGLALGVGIGLIAALLGLLRVAMLFSRLNIELLVFLVLALVPIIVGGIVGAWVRDGPDRPWRRAGAGGILIWWLILLAIFVALVVWFAFAIIAAPPDTGQGPSSPAGDIGIVFLFVSISEVIYAVVAIPLILLGATLTYPRRKDSKNAAEQEYI